MLINTPNGIINTDHLRFIQAKEEASSNIERCIVTMSDGSDKIINVGINFFTKFCGVTIQSPKDYSLVRPILPLSTRPFCEPSLTWESIIFFRHRGGNNAPVPITIAGEFQPKPGELYAIQEPSGRCIGPTGTFVRIQDFMEDCRQRANLNVSPADDEVF